MKFTSPLAIGVALLCVGCSESKKPLDTGNAVSGTIWDHPPSAGGSNSGSSISQGARVDVYERLIIVSLKDGSRQVVPMEDVTNLKLQ